MTKHSNPLLHEKVSNFEKLRKINRSFEPGEEQVYHSYVSIMYKESVEAQQTYFMLMAQADDTDSSYLTPGTIINDCCLIVGRPYLEKYMLVCEPDDMPVIAVLTHQEFKEGVEKTDNEQLEKLINFSKSIPGFQAISRSTARRIFKLFTLQRVQKGWKTNCSSNDPNPTDRKLYIITKGSFIFQSYNKQPTVAPAPAIQNKQMKNRALTTLTNFRLNKKDISNSQGDGMNSNQKNLISKFLRLGEDKESVNKISIEDKKSII